MCSNLAHWLKHMELCTLDGTSIQSESLFGKVLLIVNVASYCVYTPQYRALQALYESRRHLGLVVIGVPCNQFGAQEPGSAADIQHFCTLEFRVTFPLLSKQNVRSPNRSELYSHLVESDIGGGVDVRWNFEKFIVTRAGQVVARFGSEILPDAHELIAVLDTALSC
jgi:glutathione peroxidase-family protein